MKTTKEEFIKKAEDIHGGKYDYSKVEYINGKTKVCIICPEHGEFWQTPHNHLAGHGCPKCHHTKIGDLKRKTLEEFINDAQLIHGDKYDYSKVEYVNNSTKVCIICPEHGEFWQTPDSHINQKQGCPKCVGRNNTTDEIIERFKEIHGDKYDYSNVEYKNMNSKVKIICPEHGEFLQTPKIHLRGFGCKECSNNFLDKNLFIIKARGIHGDKYDYSKVEYVNNSTKVCIICPEHGEFWQVPNSHLNGRGCPYCKISHLERTVNDFLSKMEVDFIYQYHDKDILGQQSFDFYIPKLKIAIECQGEQHYIDNFYKSKGIEYAQEHLKYIKGLDSKKRDICKKEKIELIYFMNKTHLQYDKSNELCFSDINELGNFIKTKFKDEELITVE